MLMTLKKSQNFTYYAGIMLDAIAMHPIMLKIISYEDDGLKHSYMIHIIKGQSNF